MLIIHDFALLHFVHFRTAASWFIWWRGSGTTKTVICFLFVSRQNFWMKRVWHILCSPAACVADALSLAFAVHRSRFRLHNWRPEVWHAPRFNQAAGCPCVPLRCSYLLCGEQSLFLLQTLREPNLLGLNRLMDQHTARRRAA